MPRGVAQSGSAPGWGPGGRWFESSRPDHTPGKISRAPKDAGAPKKSAPAKGLQARFRDLAGSHEIPPPERTAHETAHTGRM